MAILDTFHSLERFDNEGTREIRTILIDYTQAVIDDEWPALSNDKLSERTGALRRQLVGHVLNLPTPTRFLTSD